jgi:hypothetical protein
MKTKQVPLTSSSQAVSNDELYGIINPATREWKDGLFSSVMRDLANSTGEVGTLQHMLTLSAGAPVDCARWRH